MKSTQPTPEVEAEMALAELTGLRWRAGQTTWRGFIVAFTVLGSVGAFPADAHTVLYAPDGKRLGVGHASGVTERELEYKTLAWGIGEALEVLAAQGGAS